MLAINNLSFYFGSRVLYEEANLHIKPKDRIGLIGANGTGKSTLLRLIVGEYTPDGGEISRSKDCTIGFLNQDLLSYQTDDSILEVALEAFEEQNKLKVEIDQLIKKLETDYSEKLINKLANLQERFELLDGYSIQAKGEEILEGLGFKTEDLERPLREFSGGWRMRVMLAKLLLQQPSLLMLDEPTNHLDLPSIQWIESYISNYEGAIIAVSHDRQFINNVSTSIVEVYGQQLHHYAGNYEFYLEEKAQRMEIQKAAFENQQQKIKQTERFIERFRAKATKARQVQSRVKSLERMDRVDDVVDENATVNFQFNFGRPSGKTVISLLDIDKAYGDLQILKEASTEVLRGDKIALIGANGKGKSTLLRIIAGTESIQNGDRELGHNVEFAFYAQHQLEALEVENGILEELKQSGSQKTETELRGILGSFLFTGDEVFKKIKVLSGGEKSRVALAKVLLSEANFLLLDEPTNHLDIQSVNVLVEALKQYQGSYVIVSHDRYFISRVANKICYIEDQDIKAYPGSYEEYEYWRKKNAANQLESSPKTNGQPTTAKKKKKPSSKEKTSEQKHLEKEIKQQKRDLQVLEDEVTKLESQKEKLEKQLADPEIYEQKEKMLELQEKYKQVDQQIEQKQEKWESLGLKIEELEAKLEES